MPLARSKPPNPRAMTILARGIGLGMLSVLGLALSASLLVLCVYAHYATSLPSPQELYDRTTSFRNTTIYDRHGRLLYEVFDPHGGRRTPVSFQDIPPVVVEATIATEDSTFFSNPGFNPLAIVRALYQNLREREMVYGASTITQQLVKNLFLTRERTLARKIKEAILAAEITRRYSKAELLEIYLNEVCYGNLAYGIGAAAQVYFGKVVSDLSLAEAALLAGMIQSPTQYDPYVSPERALRRRATVLNLMHQRGYISREELDVALGQPLGVQPQGIVMEAPHMVMYVREQLESLYGAEMLYRGGLRVYTTLDLELQHLAEEVAQEKIALLREQGATNAALLALDPQTGDVLAMLGSVDFNDREIDGQVNVTLRPRQPGSTLKPFTYLAALERGWTAATMIMDLEQEFPDGPNGPYRPTDHDQKERGPVSLRTALACSLNVPAVSTLHQVGLPALLEVTHRLGMHSLNRADYGLSLTLGGAEVTLQEVAAAYAALASGGHRVTPRTILHIDDEDGRPIMAQTAPEATLVMDPRHAYLLTHILSDNQARIPTFGRSNALELPFAAAAKTGTTDDYRDSWTIGYTPSLVVAVWVGNNDNTPMDHVSGARGAGLIWHDFVEQALSSTPHLDFERPDGLVEIKVCPVSGQRPGLDCPLARTELFLVENVAAEICRAHKRYQVCTITNKLATELCPKESVEERVFEDHGPEWDEWAGKQGRPVPPRETCRLHTSPAQVAIELPPQPLSGIVIVRGSAEIADLAHYVVEYGMGTNPLGWTPVSLKVTSPVQDGVLCHWDTWGLPGGTWSVRVVVSDHHGNRYEARTAVEIGHPSSNP